MKTDYLEPTEQNITAAKNAVAELDLKMKTPSFIKTEGAFNLQLKKQQAEMYLNSLIEESIRRSGKPYFSKNK